MVAPYSCYSLHLYMCVYICACECVRVRVRELPPCLVPGCPCRPPVPLFLVPLFSVVAVAVSPLFPCGLFFALCGGLLVSLLPSLPSVVRFFRPLCLFRCLGRLGYTPHGLNGLKRKKTAPTVSPTAGGLRREKENGQAFPHAHLCLLCCYIVGLFIFQNCLSIICCLYCSFQKSTSSLACFFVLQGWKII